MGSDPYYMQEGATFSSMTAGIPIYGAWANVTLPSGSPYSTGFEFNALSNTGDWYQAVVGYNWPGGLGCSTGGFHDIFNWWNSSGGSVGFNCDLLNNPSADDNIALDIHVDISSGQVCMEVYDWSHSSNSNSQCVSQPDPGPHPAQNHFVVLPASSNGKGYFTGPMTEVVDTSASSCQRYESMPTVSYLFDVGGMAVSSYIPWSDEWNPSTLAECYSYQGTNTTVSSTPVSDYVEASGGSSYGPHWEAGQNWAAVNNAPALEWRFQTDVNPMHLNETLSRYSLDDGQLVTVVGSVSGGDAPFHCEWFVDYAPAAGVTSCTWSYTAIGNGTHNVSVYAIDSLSDLVAAWSDVTIYSLPSVTTPSATPQAADVGEAVLLDVSATGGSGGLSYSWLGLPPGCVSADSPSIVCVPSAAGNFTIVVRAIDSNSGAATSAQLVITVYADPAITRFGWTPSSILSGVAARLSVVASGGEPPISYSYSGLPAGCADRNTSSLSCTPPGPG